MSTTCLFYTINLVAEVKSERGTTRLISIPDGLTSVEAYEYVKEYLGDDEKVIGYYDLDK